MLKRKGLIFSSSSADTTKHTSATPSYYLQRVLRTPRVQLDLGTLEWNGVARLQNVETPEWNGLD